MAYSSAWSSAIMWHQCGPAWPITLPWLTIGSRYTLTPAPVARGTRDAGRSWLGLRGVQVIPVLTQVLLAALPCRVRVDAIRSEPQVKLERCQRFERGRDFVVGLGVFKAQERLGANVVVLAHCPSSTSRSRLRSCMSPAHASAGVPSAFAAHSLQRPALRSGGA